MSSENEESTTANETVPEAGSLLNQSSSEAEAARCPESLNKRSQHKPVPEDHHILNGSHLPNSSAKSSADADSSPRPATHSLNLLNTEFARLSVSTSETGVSANKKTEVLCSDQVKLFHFERGSFFWKEKGSGVVMIIIGHRANDGYRIIVEREPDRKVLCNTKITPEMILTLKSSRSWAWVTIDSSGKEPTSETIVIFFSSLDRAVLFNIAFESCQFTLVPQLK